MTTISSLIARGLAFGLLLLSMTVAAQETFPTRAVRMIVPFPPGGGNDLLARMVGQKLSELWGQPVVIDNRPGGLTIVGTDATAKSAADGYTLMLTSSSHVILPNLMRLPFDAIKDFAPIATISSAEQVLALNPAFPPNSVKELIALAKAKPNEINFASPGAGTPSHLAVELLKSMTGVQMTHVSYKGGGPALTALVAGEVQMFFVTSAVLLPYVQAGKLKAIAISGNHRIAALPQVPTFTEAGLPNFEIAQWYGILAPAGIPPTIANKIAADVSKVIALPDVKEKLVSQGMDPMITTRAEFGGIMSSELEKYGKIVKAANIKIDQ